MVLHSTITVLHIVTTTLPLACVCMYAYMCACMQASLSSLVYMGVVFMQSYNSPLSQALALSLSLNEGLHYVRFWLDHSGTT